MVEGQKSWSWYVGRVLAVALRGGSQKWLLVEVSHGLQTAPEPCEHILFCGSVWQGLQSLNPMGRSKSNRNGSCWPRALMIPWRHIDVRKVGVIHSKGMCQCTLCTFISILHRCVLLDTDAWTFRRVLVSAKAPRLPGDFAPVWPGKWFDLWWGLRLLVTVVNLVYDGLW